MALNIQKKTATPVVDEKSAEESLLEQLADQIGDLEPSVASAKKIVKDYDALVKKAKELAVSLGIAPDDEITVIGTNHSVKISAAELERKVANKNVLLEILGEDNFIALASFKLTDLDKYVPVAEQDKVIEKTYGTTRKLSVVS